MRIGIDIKAFKNGSTGIQVYLSQLLDALQRTDTENDYFLYEPLPSSYRVFNPRWKKMTISSRLPGTLWMQFYIPPRIKKDALDLFWGPEQVCPLWKMSPVCYLTTIHDFTFIRFPKTARLSTRIILGLSWRRVLSISDALLAVSDSIREETIALASRMHTPAKVHTVSNAGPGWTPPSSYTPEKRSDTLLFVGNIEPRKNLITLIDALELLHERGIRPQLIIIGAASWNSGPFRKRYERSIVREQITISDYISTEALQQHYLSCKALVFPSLYEGFGIPALEALALDCLLLTSRGTAMESVVGECACYFDPRSPEEIATCIERIYQPDFRREPYLAKRNEILSRYTWKQSAEKLLTIFRELGCSQQTGTSEPAK